MAATCLMLHRPSSPSSSSSTHHPQVVLMINNLNPSDSLYSKSLVPFSFWGFPFLQHEPNAKPSLNDILQHNQIQIDPPKERHATLLDKVTTPNFIDSVFDVSFVSYALEESEKLIFPPSHNQFSFHMLPAQQLLQDFKNCTLHLSPEVSRALRHLTSSPPTDSDLDLEFSPNFHCFPIRSNTIPPFKTTNLIVVVSQTTGVRGRTALLVDPGASAEGKDAMLAVLRKLRAQGVGELLVFITHHHKDHWEGLPYLAADGIFDASVITVLGHKLSMDKFDGQFTKKIVDDGDAIQVGEISIKVVGTPGHTDNSLSLFHEPTRTLVAGDHIVGMGSAVLDFQCGNMKQYFESTKKMIALNPRVAYPAHGPPNFAPLQLLETYLKHRQAREDAILAAYNAGNHNLDAIVKAVYTDVPESMWGFAKSNISLHLAKLREDGKIGDPPKL